MCVLLRTVSEIELFVRTVIWIWRPIVSFPPAILRHCLQHVNRCEASAGRYYSDRDIAGVLWKTPRTFFTNTEYAYMLWVYGFCDDSVTVAVEKYCRRFPLRRIPDRRAFSKVFNTLCEYGTLPSSHVSSERARQQYVEEQENILEMVQRSPTRSKRKFLHVSVFHGHVCGEHCTKTACNQFTQSVCKICTQETMPCVLNFVSAYILIANCFHYYYSLMNLLSPLRNQQHT
jgi:hypothetical protein